MTVTGYLIEGIGDNNAVHMCTQCIEPFSVSADGRRVKEIASSQYRHGNGGGTCIFCGFNTLDALSSRAVKGKTERENVTNRELPNELQPYADAIDAVTDAFVAIRLGPGVEPEHTEIAPGVTMASHPDDAPETLIIEFQRDTEQDEHKEICNTILDLFSDTPLKATYCPDNRGDGMSDAVLAVTT